MDRNLSYYMQSVNRNTSINAGSSDLRVDIKRSWGGIYENVSPTNLPDYGLTNVINGIGQGTYIEKMSDVKVLGKHENLEFSIKSMIVLRIMDFFDQLGRYHLLKICSTPDGDKIYELVDNNKDLLFQNQELSWSDITTPANIQLNTTAIYNWARWRNELYIVSGDQFTINDKVGGVLRYTPNSPVKWQVIDTGISASSNPLTTGDDGDTYFKPKTISFHKDEMYIANDFQVKKAEHSNPDNVTGANGRPFLGLLDEPPTIEDLLRPSTFIPSQNGDKITALISTNNFLWIVTNKRFYAFRRLTTLDTQLPPGLLWLDTIQEHKAKTGTFTQKSIMLNDELFDFLTTNKVSPTLASVIPIVGQERVDKVYASNSVFLRDTMKEIDWSEAAMGILGYGEGDALNFISGKICNSDFNNITIMYKKFNDTILFSKLYDENEDNWKANDWLNNDYTTMYGSSVNGNVYTIETEKHGDYNFTLQTGKIGVAAGDSDFSGKILEKIWISCYASKGMQLKLEIFKNPNCASEDCGCEDLVFEALLDVGCIDDKEECIQKNPFKHRKGYYFTKIINVKSKMIKYNTLDIRLTAMGKGYFAQHDLAPIYKLDTPIDTNLILEDETLKNK